MTTETPKPVFSVALEPIASSDPKHLAASAQRIADQLTIKVEYDFNGVHCVAQPGGSAKRLYESVVACQLRMAQYAGIKNQVAMS